MERFARLCLLASAVFLSVPGAALAGPLVGGWDDELPFNGYPSEHFLLDRYRRADKVPLRIMPLGASIMSGAGSPSHNGLRKPLRDALRLAGWEVDMVGSLHDGTFKDYEHEAVPGDVLTQVRARVSHSTGFKPNIVIINAGTNDANGNVDLDGAGSRMNDILDDLWKAPGMADTCIMLSTLLPTTHPVGQVTRLTINDQYRNLVRQRSGDGKCVYLADMDPNDGAWWNFDTDFSPLSASEKYHIHPNDVGHRKMAAVFYDAINRAASDGKLKTPGAIDVPGGSVCDKYAGTGIGAGGETQHGIGSDDGIYYHSSEGMDIIWTHDSNWDINQFRFARLFSRDYDDLVAWLNSTAEFKEFVVWSNSADGQGTFTNIANMYPDLFCNPIGLHFIDMNADGLDDIMCIDANGNAYLSINQGDGNRASGKPPTFKRASTAGQKVKDGEGYLQNRVVLGDIDGDGRGDYGVIDDQGNVYFWRNSGVGDFPDYWQYLGLRFTDKNKGDTRGVRFEDINGDGRDDWLWVSDVGETTTYTNARSCAQGDLEDGLNVAWRQGFLAGQSSGPTHLGVGFMTDTETYLRDRIFFARIYGEPSAFGNLGKQDYGFLQHTKLASGLHRFELHAWKNTGGGGTKLKADGDKYCNMMGNSDGRDDYIWTYSTGEMVLYANRGKKSITDSDPDGFWDPKGTIFIPPRNMDRRDLHLADWDGDGDCDIIYVDPNNGGVEVFINTYPQTGKWGWASHSVPGLSCAQKRGIGIVDLAVRFADLTGNKRADYLCIEPDSRVTGFVHNDDGSFTDVGQIKYAPHDRDRPNVRWADVNGDSRDDMLWIDKFSGDTWVWYNEGRGDPSKLNGSSFSWRFQEQKAYDGLAAGTCVYYPDLNGDGHADEHYLAGTFTNQAHTSFSPGCGLTDVTGDDADMDGSLPALPGQGGNTGHDNPSGGGGVCGYNFDSTDPAIIKGTWEKSTAGDFLANFLKANGANHWSDHFFSTVLNGGTQGGSTYDCDHFHTGNCPGPLSTSCSSYSPNEAFYVHVSIGWLYSAFEQIWAGMVTNGIGNLATTIKAVIAAYGTPPTDDNPFILAFLVGILTSLAGIGGALERAFPGIDAAKLFGSAANPLTFISGIVNALGGNATGYSNFVDPDELNKKFEDAYGAMFLGIIGGLNSSINNIFDGQAPMDYGGSNEDYVAEVFQDGRWLSKEIVDPLVNAYVTNTQTKFVEFATVRAMQTGNKAKYALLFGNADTPYLRCVNSSDPSGGLGGPSFYPLTEDVCGGIGNCIWYSDNCICLGTQTLDGIEWCPLEPDDVSDLKNFIVDYESALRNNFDCLKPILDNPQCDPILIDHPKECDIPDPTVPDISDFDASDPTKFEYSKCFFNFSGGTNWNCGFST